MGMEIHEINIVRRNAIAILLQKWLYANQIEVENFSVGVIELVVESGTPFIGVR